MTDGETRDLLVELSRSLFDRGYSVGSAGNISVRTQAGYLMTPTNSSLGRLRADSLSVLDADFRHVGGDRPSKEVPMHRAVYEARPGTGAVVHLHSTHLTALSCLWVPGQPLIEALTPYFVMRVGRDIPVVGYFKPGSTEKVDEIFQAATQAPAIVLAHHGSLVAGDTLAAAVNAAEELEETAKISLLLRGAPANTLNPDQIEALLS